MFKNLKNRLESETSKIKQTASQYGEQLTAQIGQYRQSMNEPGAAGSDASASISKRFLNSVGGGSEKGAGSEKNDADTSMESSSAIMSEIPEADLLGLGLSSQPSPTRRKRTPSEESTNSNESTLASLLNSIPNVISSTFETIPSDSESVASDAFSVRSTNDPAYTSRLKQRLATYKAKYRDAVHRHNQLVDENRNTKKLLESTQDACLQKIEHLRCEKRVLAEKLREAAGSEELEKKCDEYRKMLEQCRLKIKALQQERKGEQQLVEVDNPRVLELQERIQKTEEEWTNRINDSDQQHAISLATTKAEMHAALENKDSEIEQWRRKCAILEQQDTDANQRWHEKVEKVQAVNKALEAEKNEMIEKLSEAKTQGVRAVLEEEERKRVQIEAELNEEIEKSNELVEKMRLEMATLKVQLEAKESKEFDENKEDVEALKLELATALSQKSELETKIADHLSSFDIYRLEAEKTLNAANEQFVRKTSECDTWREKYEERAAASEHIATVEFETLETDTQRTQLFEVEKRELAEKCEKLTADFERAQKEKDEMAHQLSRLQEEMLEKCSHLEAQLSEARQLSEETQRKYDDVAKRAEEVQSELRESRDALQAEKDAFKQEKDEEQVEQMNKALQELSLAQSTLEELNRKLEESEKETHSTREAVEELTKKLEESEKETNLAKADLEEVNTKLRNSETALAEFSTLADSLKSQLSEAERQKEEGVELLKQKLEDVERHLETSETQKTRVEEEVRCKEKEHAEATETLKKALEAAENAVEALRKEAENERSLRNALESDEQGAVQEMRKQMEEAKRALETAESERKTLKERLAELQKEHDDGRVEVEKMQKAWADEMAVVEKTSGEERVARDNLLRELETANERIRELETSTASDAEKVEALQTKIHELTSSTSSETEKLRKALEEAEKLLETTSSEVEDLQAKNSELQKTLEEATSSESARHAEEVEKLKKALELSEATSSEVEKHAEEVQNLQKALEAANTTSSELKTRLEARIQELESLTSSESERHAEEVERLQNALKATSSDAEQQLARLQKELEGREQSERALTAEIDVLTGALAGKEHQLARLAAEQDEKVGVVRLQLEQASSSAEHALRAEMEQLKETNIGGELKVRELSELNEKMRIEFIAKEKVISDLRGELRTLESELVVQKATVEKTKMDGEERERRAHTDRENERDEERRLRETFAAELENVAKSVQEKETAYTELKQKADRKMAKMRAEFEEKKREEAERHETERKEAVEATEAQRKTAETEREAERKRLEETIGDVEARCEKLQREVDELEASRSARQKEVEQWEEERQSHERKATELGEQIDVMQREMSALRQANETKAAKVDSDSRKVVRELQKEVKQLYNELNERNQQFDTLQEELRSLKSSTSSEENGRRLQAQQKLQQQEEEDRRSEFSYKEEIASLRQKLNASLNEADDLRLQVSRSGGGGKTTSNGAATKVGRKSSSMELHGIADPAEAEYLRNVLYRYMTSRESLGKESVTLARVIGTVARFDDSQMKQVISSEESRQASWAAAVGGTVSHALNR